MQQTREALLKCIEIGILDKRAMAKELLTQGLYPNLEAARSAVRNVFGASGRPVSKANHAVYDAYMAALNKDDQYAIASKKELKHSPVYFITSAMNNTPVHEGFWKCLMAYRQYYNAELHVIAIRYKNPTSVWTARQQVQEVWDPKVVPFLDANRHALFDKYYLMGDVKIQPTAALPLSGMNGMTGPESCIFGHTRVHMQFMPVLKGSEPKMMLTTGACTEPIYTDSKAGKKGHHHHTLGFVVVTEDDMHYVTANSDGSFIDYNIQVKDGIITDAPPPKALILGDIHVAQLSQESRARIIRRLLNFSPEVVICHDVFDAYSCNPHTEKDPIKKVRRFENQRYSIGQEIDEALEFLRELGKYCPEVVVVASNHDNMLDRYIANMDWRKDIPNASMYAQLLPIALREESVFAYLANQIEGVTCLGINDSYEICGIECGQHGHLGANGSRGSVTQYKELSVKMWVGHGHTGYRIDGVCAVGPQDLDHGYNNGLSSWSIADGLINADGKRQHIHYQ